MEQKENIIAIRKRDIAQAHDAFVDLMSRTERILNIDAGRYPVKYRTISAADLEKQSVECIKMVCGDSPFDASEVKLISQQRFPDIVASGYYGVEVKSTKDDKWTSTGSSIVEKTRVEGVEDIYMLFGKLGGKTPEFKCRPYQDVLYDIAVTHSPRYLIDMTLDSSHSIFTKMGTTYDSFRTSKDSIAQVRHYFRAKALKSRKHEMPWWITSENLEEPSSFNFKLWSSLDLQQKKEMQAKCMLLFPDALNPARVKDKYSDIILWLCTCNQVVNPNVRDMFSAGGKIRKINGRSLDQPVPKVFKVIVEFSEYIKLLLANPSGDLLEMLYTYNNPVFKSNDRFQKWIDQCCTFACAYGIPLRSWIEDQPVLQ